MGFYSIYFGPRRIANCSWKVLALPSICKATAKTLQLNGIGFWCLCRLTAKASCLKKGLWLGTSKSDALGDYVVLTIVSSEWKWMEHAENPFFVFILPSVRSKTLPTPPTQVAQLQHASYSNTLVVSVKFSAKLLADLSSWSRDGQLPLHEFKFRFEQLKTYSLTLRWRVFLQRNFERNTRFHVKHVQLSISLCTKLELQVKSTKINLSWDNQSENSMLNKVSSKNRKNIL